MDKEKLLMVMLCDFMLKTTEKESVLDYAKIRAALVSNNAWALGKWYPDVLGSSSSERNWIAEEISLILKMWLDVEHAISSGCGSLQPRIEMKFTGFCAIQESEELKIARFMIDNFETFKSFRGRPIESSAPMMSCYRRLIDIHRCLIVSGQSSPQDMLTMLGETMLMESNDV